MKKSDELFAGGVEIMKDTIKQFERTGEIAEQDVI